MASRGDTVYILRAWEAVGYDVYERNLEVFSSEYEAHMMGEWLQKNYYRVNNYDPSYGLFRYSVVAKELS